jgi:hypothetical protein
MLLASIHASCFLSLQRARHELDCVRRDVPELQQHTRPYRRLVSHLPENCNRLGPTHRWTCVRIESKRERESDTHGFTWLALPDCRFYVYHRADAGGAVNIITPRMGSDGSPGVGKTSDLSSTTTRFVTRFQVDW